MSRAPAEVWPCCPKCGRMAIDAAHFNSTGQIRLPEMVETWELPTHVSYICRARHEWWVPEPFTIEHLNKEK